MGIALTLLLLGLASGIWGLRYPEHNWHRDLGLLGWAGCWLLLLLWLLVA